MVTLRFASFVGLQNLFGNGIFPGVTRLTGTLSYSFPWMRVDLSPHVIASLKEESAAMVQTDDSLRKAAEMEDTSLLHGNTQWNPNQRLGR